VTKVAEIIDVVRTLSLDERNELRRALEALDENEWNAGLDQSTEEWRRSEKTDADIDAAVMRRRYEGRP